MIFPEKLQLLRKSKGLTQEELAEKVSVSRQAITKWESGQAYPDISNLISLSEFFKTTIDHLVKDNDSCITSIVKQDSCDSKELIDFLIKAKCNTYAAKGRECASSRPNSHDLRYEEGVFLYLDTYVGSECFSGEEAVWKNNIPIYAMNYSGRVTSSNFSGDFLKAALMAVPNDKPFRGPDIYVENDYFYNCKVCGDLKWHQGYEEIYYKNLQVYECYFHGGIVK